VRRALRIQREIASSAFQRAIESVEILPVDDQLLLIEVIRKRLTQHRRAEVIAQVAEARAACQAGQMCCGTVEELLEELAQDPDA